MSKLKSNNETDLHESFSYQEERSIRPSHLVPKYQIRPKLITGNRLLFTASQCALDSKFVSQTNNLDQLPDGSQLKQINLLSNLNTKSTMNTMGTPADTAFKSLDSKCPSARSPNELMPTVTPSNAKDKTKLLKGWEEKTTASYKFPPDLPKQNITTPKHIETSPKEAKQKNNAGLFQSTLQMSNLSNGASKLGDDLNTSKPATSGNTVTRQSTSRPPE